MRHRSGRRSKFRANGHAQITVGVRQMTGAGADTNVWCEQDGGLFASDLDITRVERRSPGSGWVVRYGPGHKLSRDGQGVHEAGRPTAGR